MPDSGSLGEDRELTALMGDTVCRPLVPTNVTTSLIIWSD